ncbi:hypothetical protein V8C42DRAFT_356477 [Trichoderma barbatum]
MYSILSILAAFAPFLPHSRKPVTVDLMKFNASTILLAVHKDASRLSTTEAELRILQLKYDVTRAVAPPRSEGTPYIEAAKGQVKSIINEINMTFFNEASIRIAIVGYKDHRDSCNTLDFFTLETDQDVLGGIRQSLNAKWKLPTRCIIHIASAPPHGSTLHDLGSGSDTYANPGSEPHHLTHETLLKQMIELNINYALLRINNTTDRMSFTFFQDPTDTTAKYAANLSGLVVTFVGALFPDAAPKLCCNLRS